MRVKLTTVVALLLLGWGGFWLHNVARPSPLPQQPVGRQSIVLPELCLSVTDVSSAMRHLSEHLDARRADGTCAGRHNEIVCDPDTFWTPRVPEPKHLKPALRNTIADAADAAAQTPATPWLSIGSLKYTGNYYIDWLVFSVFFRDPRWVGRGTFLESGGSNGVHASNTLFFERSLNWTGVLIEPTPCALCEIPLNRRATSIHAALQIRGGPKTFDPSSMKDFCRLPSSCLETDPWRQVKASRLQSLMGSAGFTNVNFLSIDVEDFGEAVVSDLDFSKGFAPTVIVAECRNDVEKCVRVFEAAGYLALPANAALKEDVLAWKNGRHCEFQ